MSKTQVTMTTMMQINMNLMKSKIATDMITIAKAK